MSYDDWDAAGVRAITVTLMRDSDGNGVGETIWATTTSSDTGAYTFSVQPGCYVVVFTVPAGQQVLKGVASKPVCLNPGQDDPRIDLVISRPFVKPPAACEVQIGNNRYAGVEIQDRSGVWASSYAFYDKAGKWLLSTKSFGPPDDVESSPPSVEWTSERFKYDEEKVDSVLAEDGLGNISERVKCKTVKV